MHLGIGIGVGFPLGRGSEAPPPPPLSAPTRVSGSSPAGIFREGQRLTVGTPAVYNGNPTPSIQYRWQMRPNGGGTITTIGVLDFLDLGPSHVGMQIRLQDMASNSQGSTAWAGATWSPVVTSTSSPVGPSLKPNTRTNPATGMLLNWDGPDSNNSSPFIDWLKVGPEWQTSGATHMNYKQLVAAGHITEDGTILSIPAGADNLRMTVLSHIPTGTGALAGRFHLLFSGDGGIGFSGAGSVDWPAVGKAEFNHTPNGESFVVILVDRVDQPIRFQALVHDSDWSDYQAGKTFRRSWLNTIRNERVLRFTDWMGVDNYQGSGLWADRYAPNRITYQGGEGVPVEVMCRLCEEVGSDPWFSFVSNADTDYIVQFATIALAELGADREPYVERSNKIWDGANWATANYFRDLAVQWFSDSSVEACMEAYGGVSSDTFDAWKSIWTGVDADRVHTVLQGWTPNSYVTEFALTAPRWVAQASGRVAPHTKATELALHANLDGGLRYSWIEGNMETIEVWMETLTDAQIFDNMANAFRGSMTGIEGGYTLSGLQDSYAAQKALLVDKGFALTPICYEGGSHLAVPPDTPEIQPSSNPRWRQIYIDFHTTPQFASVWSDSITQAWYGAFGPESFYTRKNDLRLPDANNGYGLLRWEGDTSGNLQLGVWENLQASREGAPGRGSETFVGPFDLAELGA